MYYTTILKLIQPYICPSPITCVNSMDVSYIPIAKARGFTTPLDKKDVSVITDTSFLRKKLRKTKVSRSLQILIILEKVLLVNSL